jgi:hypothetical protein
VVDGSGLENLCTGNGVGLYAIESKQTEPWMRVPKRCNCSKTVVVGEMAEWLKAPVLKTGIRETVSGVRIPLSPP